MIEGDLLRTKTAQVSAEHQREVTNLGLVRERENQARNRVESREERFWREIANASKARSDGQIKQPGAESAAIARALEAHRLLKQAKDEHKGVTQEVTQQVARVIRSKVAVTAFKNLQTKERIQHENRLAERQGEEIQEIGVSAKLRASSKRVGFDIERDSDLGESLSQQLSQWREVSSPIQTTSDGARSPGGTSKPETTPSSTSVADGVALHAATLTSTEQGQSLKVQVESRGVPLACRVSERAAGQVGVVVEAAHGGLVNRLERDKSLIAAKLAGLGIKVDRVEVRQDSSVGDSAAAHFRRGRRTKEEQDENTIA